MTPESDFSSEDLGRLTNIRDDIRNAIDAIERAQNEREREREQLRRLQGQLDHERRRAEWELEQFRDQATRALQKGLVELLQVLGAKDPWSEGATLRKQNDDLRRRIRELESQLGATRQELERMRGSRESLQTENTQIRNELKALPDREQSQIFASLLNHLGVSQIAPLLCDQNAVLDKDMAAILLGRLISYLQERNIQVTDVPGQGVVLENENALARYEIGEQYRAGPAEVVQHGISYKNQVIIKARVRYKKEQVDESKSDGCPNSEPQQ